MRYAERRSPRRRELLKSGSAAIEPGDGAFDDPSFGYDLEADCAVRSLDDFNLERGKKFCQRVGELRSLISAVGEEFVQKRKHSE